MNNLETFERKGINPSKIVCVFIIDGIRNFYKTYNRSEGLASFTKKLLDFDQLLAEWEIEGEMTEK